MDGFSILQHMKQDSLLQHIPVILASALGIEAAVTAAIEGEITVVRANKFSPVELVNCVEAVVNVLVPSTASMLPGS